MLELFRRSDKMSKEFARKISRYEAKSRITGKKDEKQLNKLLRDVRRHVRRRLPKDSPYREINQNSMCKLRVTAFYNLNDVERELIGIEDYCMNNEDTASDYDIHEVWVRVPIEHSKLFVAYNFKYKVKRQ